MIEVEKEIRPSGRRAKARKRKAEPVFSVPPWPGLPAPVGPPDFVAWTGASCRPNPGRGGWAAIILDDDGELRMTGFDPKTTSIRMEMLAAIRALEGLPDGSGAMVCSGSAYLTNGASNWIKTWHKKGRLDGYSRSILNADLWRCIRDQNSRLHVKWNWVQAHIGTEMHELAYELADAARERGLTGS